MQTHPDIPPRMFTSQVLELAKFGQGTLMKRRREHRFPEPIDRGREAIYSGPEVYRALGLVSGVTPTIDPILAALEGLR